MTDFINVTSNAAEIEARLMAMTTKVAKKTVRQAVRGGQKIILAETQLNARNMVRNEGETGMSDLIAKNLVIKSPKKQKSFAYLLMVRLRANVSGFVDKQHYIPAAIEYGHGLPGSAGTKSKTVAPIPFMRTAVDQEGDRALQRAVAILRFGIESEFANPIQVSAVRRVIGTSPFGLLGAGTSLAVG